MAAEAYQFVIGRSYTRQDVFGVLGIDDPGGGNSYTGYASHRGDWFIFCGTGTPGARAMTTEIISPARI